jgi:hypothetical protein
MRAKQGPPLRARIQTGSFFLYRERVGRKSIDAELRVEFQKEKIGVFCYCCLFK